MPERTVQRTQIPPAGSINLDHIAHFVPDEEASRRALVALGFAPAPFSEQYHRLHDAGELVPAGSGNHCVMLRQGYLEFLVPLADTPVAAQLRAAMDRYVGVHSIVFGSPDADADHARLSDEGFGPLAPIRLQRAIGTLQGESVVHFTVVRVSPGTMAEGRIQFCQHHTEELVWQQRWLEHPNGALGIVGVTACVPDLREAVHRYERFTGLTARSAANGICRLEAQRGWIELCERSVIEERLQTLVPAMPWIAGCTLTCRSTTSTRRYLEGNGLTVHPLGPDEICVAGPAAIGGYFGFVSA